MTAITAAPGHRRDAAVNKTLPRANEFQALIAQLIEAPGEINTTEFRTEAPMMNRKILVTALILAGLGGAGPASGQTKWTEVKRDESNIRLQLPGLAQSRERYAWIADARYTGITHSGTQAAPRADYPRGASVTVQAFTATASIQTRLLTFDEDGLKKFSGFFKDRSLTVERSPTPDSTYDRQIRRFSVDGASCVAFEVYPTGVDRIRQGGGTGTVAIAGYYCGPPGVPLTDTDIQWVLWGNEFAMPPKNTFVRLAAAPASPPSQRLGPSAATGQVQGGRPNQ